MHVDVLAFIDERFSHVDAMHKCVVWCGVVRARRLFLNVLILSFCSTWLFAELLLSRFFFCFCLFCSHFFFLRDEAGGETKAAGRGKDLARPPRRQREEEKQRGFGGLVGVQIVASLLPRLQLRSERPPRTLSAAVRSVRGLKRGGAHGITRLLFSLSSAVGDVSVRLFALLAVYKKPSAAK